MSIERDAFGGWPVLERARRAEGPVIAMVSEAVQTPDGGHIRRDFVTHPGSVAIVAVDDQERLVLLAQYRHPVRGTLIELPAGLLDAPGEDPRAAAARELAEEVELAADRWHVLVDLFASPGCSQEVIRVFLAEGLRPAARPDGFVVAGEEAHLRVFRRPFAEVLDGVLAGDLGNPALVAGVLALQAVRSGHRVPRPGDAPWPARASLRTG